MNNEKKGIGGIITAIVFIGLLFIPAFMGILGAIQYFLGDHIEKFIEVPVLVYFALPIYFVSVLFMIHEMAKRYDYLEDNKYYYCPKCKAPVKYDAKVCPSCNESLEDLLEYSDEPGRKKLYAILFAVFLGGLGIHNYYLKRYKEFYRELTISLITVGLLLPLMHLIAIIEAIRIGVNNISHDGDGRKIS